MSEDCAELRRLMVESVRSPTATTVSKIISDSVTTSAKPGTRAVVARVDELPLGDGFNGFEFWDFEGTGGFRSIGNKLQAVCDHKVNFALICQASRNHLLR
jgi:hypothetical protein